MASFPGRRFQLYVFPEIAAREKFPALRTHPACSRARASSRRSSSQSAQACISGIQGLWEGVNDSGEYVWVGAWNAKAAASIKNMAKTMNEAHAEVDDMGKSAKAKKAAEDKKELEAIQAQPGNGESGNGEAAAQQQKKNGDPDILNGMKKPKSTVSKDADEFL